MKTPSLQLPSVITFGVSAITTTAAADVGALDLALRMLKASVTRQ